MISYLIIRALTAHPLVGFDLKRMEQTHLGLSDLNFKVTVYTQSCQQLFHLHPDSTAHRFFSLHQTLCIYS